MAKLEEKVTINTALEATKFGRFNYSVIIVSGLILINVVVECCGISFVLPVINCDMDLSYQQKGILGAVSFLGMISSSHLWGFLADTTGRRSVIRPTLIIGYLVTVISSFSPNFWTLAFLRYVNGFMISGGSATVFAYLGEFHCNKERNRAILSAAFISAFSAIGFPITAWAFINQSWSLELEFLDIVYKPWRLFILVAGLLGLVCGLILFFIPESPKYLLSVGKEEEALQVLRKMYSINTGEPEENFKIQSIIPDNDEVQRFKAENGKGCSVIAKSMWIQTVPLFMREHSRKTILACVIQFWIFFTAHGVYMWFPFILNKVMLFTSLNPTARLDICGILSVMEDDVSTTVANSTMDAVEETCNQSLELSTYKHTLSLEFIYVGLVVGIGYFTGKVGRIPTLFIILLVCGVCGVLSVTITNPIVAVYFHIILLVCGLATTVVNLIAVDIFPTNLRAMAVCISLMMGRIGSVTGTNVIGVLIEHHCMTSLLTASGGLIASAFLALLLPSGIESKKKNNCPDEA